MPRRRAGAGDVRGGAVSRVDTLDPVDRVQRHVRRRQQAADPRVSQGATVRRLRGRRGGDGHVRRGHVSRVDRVGALDPVHGVVRRRGAQQGAHVRGDT